MGISFKNLPSVSWVSTLTFKTFQSSCLGLERILNRKLDLLPPPSDVLSEDERWIEERRSPNGPTQWTRKSP